MSQFIENTNFLSEKAWQSVRSKFSELSWLKNSDESSISELSPVFDNTVVQRLVLNVLEPLGEGCFFEDNFGFRQTDTLNMALSRVRELVAEGYVWLGLGHIEGCFNQLPFEPVLKKLQKLCSDKELVSLVRQMLDSQETEPERSLFPDMLLAPFLCNLYLHDLDRVLQRKKVFFVRFHEDFIVFAFEEQAAFKALGLAERQLGKMGLELNPSKTRVIRSASEYKFRGKRLPNSKLLFQRSWLDWRIHKAPALTEVGVSQSVAGRFFDKFSRSY